MEEMGYNMTFVANCLVANKLNNATTLYYLLSEDEE